MSDCPSNNQKWDSNKELLIIDNVIKMLSKMTVKKYSVLISFAFHEILFP